MSGLAAFVLLGFRHITDAGALDHILFLVALAAIYRLRDWRDTLWVVSAFTVGHSATLALAVTGTLTLPSAVIEFLVPLTIVATGLENVAVAARDRTSDRAAGGRRRYRPVLAATFGLVHGAGFANYLRALFDGQGIALPLFGFNVGIELGQVVVLVGAFALLALVDRAIGAMGLPRTAPGKLRLRVLAVSSVVIVVATHWAVERRPW